MSGIFSSLSNASSALQTHGKMVELTGKNISNLNNPKYARQRVTLGNLGGTSSGSSIQSGALVATGIEQLRNKFADKQLLSEISYTASLETQDARLRQLLSGLGESIDRVNDPAFLSDNAELGTGIRSSIDNFFNAFESFSARPNDATTKQVLFQAAQSLTENFNRIDGRITGVADSLDEEILSEVAVLNRRLKEVADLNLEISRLEITGSGGASNELRDERQSKLEEISKTLLIEVEEASESGGQINVFARSTTGEQISLVEVGNDPLGIAFDESTGEFHSLANGGELDLQAGSLAALSELRNVTIVETRSEIDDLANAIATEVNEIYYQAFVPAGVDPAVPEISFFAQPTPPPSVSGIPATVTAGTIALYQGSTDPLVTDSTPLTAQTLRATSTDFAGSNELASAIAALGSGDVSSLDGIGFSEHAIRTVVTLGQDISDVANRLDVQKSVEAILTDQRDQFSGVSLDEEVANLVQYQRAFQASSRVFNVLSEMLETIVTGLR